jgi:hypothetical protein
VRREDISAAKPAKTGVILRPYNGSETVVTYHLFCSTRSVLGLQGWFQYIDGVIPLQKIVSGRRGVRSPEPLFRDIFASDQKRLPRNACLCTTEEVWSILWAQPRPSVVHGTPGQVALRDVSVGPQLQRGEPKFQTVHSYSGHEQYMRRREDYEYERACTNYCPKVAWNVVKQT